MVTLENALLTRSEKQEPGRREHLYCLQRGRPKREGGRRYKVKKGGNWENQAIISGRKWVPGSVKTAVTEVETENCLLFSPLRPHHH